jgi:RNA polymerase sigma factor (sigma-70 family)
LSERESHPRDTARFGDMVLPHLDSAYNLARWLTRDHHHAEDIVQEAYLRAFRSFGGFRGDNARPWLLAIVRNTCYTWLSQHRRAEVEVPYDDDIHGGDDVAQGGNTSAHGDDPETILARRDDIRLVDEALQRLPLGYREVVVLRDIEDLSYKDIATVAGLPIGTVMSRLARGRKLLVTQLAQLRDGNGDQDDHGR